MPAVSSGIDWAGSLGFTWRLREMDPASWQPGGDVPGVVSAAVSRDAGGKLLESGSAAVQAGVAYEPREMWARIEVLADSGSAVERWPVATLLLVPGDAEIRRGMKSVPYDGYSVLKAAQDLTLPTGYSVRAGDDGAAAAAGILSRAFRQAGANIPVTARGSFTLSQGVVLSRGTSCLDAAWMLADAAGWCIQVQPDGSVEVKPKPDEPALAIDHDAAGLLGTAVSAPGPVNGAPNTYIAVDGLSTARAVIEGAGRPVEYYDDAPKRVNGESLQDYAERRLAELNEVVGTRTYQRAWVPGLTVFDRIDGKLPEAGLDAPMRIVSQHMALGGGMLMVDEGTEVLS